MADTRIRPSDEVVQENIKKWNIPQPDREYTVLIHCTTYNHGKFIKDALEGFVMQKCSYSFCAIIIDDCSTDNNQEIIKEYAAKYPDIIKPILLGENHMQHGILRDPYFEKWHQSAKYIAMCEGDDYWIDETKLQKQLDYLENHPDVGMCYTNFHVLTNSSGKMKENVLTTFPHEYSYDYTLGDWIRKVNKCYVGPMTWVVRTSLLQSQPTIPVSVDGSFSSFAFFKYSSKTHCLLNYTTAVYRINQGSITQSISLRNYYNRIKGLCQQQLVLADLYLESDKVYSIDYIRKNYYTNYFRLIYLLENEEERNKVKEYKNLLSKKDRVLMALCESPKFLSIYRYLYRQHYIKKNRLEK